MTTNREIKVDSKLYLSGQELLLAAHKYWKQYQNENGSAAVVWLEGDDGHFILFTRSEYKHSIIANAQRECGGQELMFEPFSKVKQP